MESKSEGSYNWKSTLERDKPTPGALASLTPEKLSTTIIWGEAFKVNFLLMEKYGLILKWEPRECNIEGGSRGAP